MIVEVRITFSSPLPSLDIVEVGITFSSFVAGYNTWGKVYKSALNFTLSFILPLKLCFALIGTLNYWNHKNPPLQSNFLLRKRRKAHTQHSFGLSLMLHVWCMALPLSLSLSASSSYKHIIVETVIIMREGERVKYIYTHTTERDDCRGSSIVGYYTT